MEMTLVGLFGGIVSSVCCCCGETAGGVLGRWISGKLGWGGRREEGSSVGGLVTGIVGSGDVAVTVVGI